MGDTASLGLSMARTSEACAAVVIFVWRCQFTLRGVCMQEHASRAPRTFYMQGWKPRSDFDLPFRAFWFVVNDSNTRACTKTSRAEPRV